MMADADNYNMHSGSDRRKDHVIIFANKTFDDKKFPELIWVDRDAIAMGSFWSPYSIRLVHDKKAKEMQDIIKDLSKEITEECSCFVMIFLTYGEHGLIHAKDKEISLQHLIEPLKGNNCLKLAGKPKIIILQTDTSKLQMDADTGEVMKTIPSEADFIYLWSRLPGEKGMDQPHENGSLFISTLISMLTTYPREHLLKIMRRTISFVESRLIGFETDFQELPFVISQLRKHIVIPATT